MSDLHQAAMRAAENVDNYFDGFMPCDIFVTAFYLDEIATIISSEFAPLLAEACGLLEGAKEDLEQWETSYDDIAAFLAKHKEQGNG